MEIKKIVTICSMSLLFILPSSIESLANTLYPYKTELILSKQERKSESVFLKNEDRKSIFVTPIVYSFNPETLQIEKKENYIFVRTDIEEYEIKPEQTLEVKYEVVPPRNMPNGSYFNLIVLQNQQEEEFSKKNNPVSLSDSLSHLVVLHTTEGEIQGIGSDFANITLEIVENGIPFIRNTRIKYTYQNKTNYVLNPMGEIQIYNKKGSYPPVYMKINEANEKLYPGGFIEEEFEIEKYAYTDIFNERTIVGRFYNGIDENVIIQEIQQETSYMFLGSIIVISISLFALIRSILKETVFSKKKSA